MMKTRLNTVSTMMVREQLVPCVLLFGPAASQESSNHKNLQVYCNPYWMMTTMYDDNAEM